jgi:pimeloyl-ACP methyl ester carboxylesterase
MITGPVPVPPQDTPKPRRSRQSARALSEQPLDLGGEELAAIGQPALIVAAEDSPEVLRRVVDRLTDALPRAQKVLVTGGHLIDPAHPVVLDFIGTILTPHRNSA